MKKILSTLRYNYSGIYKIFLFVTSIVLIALLFPKEGKFKYEFQQGKPWMHDDMIAPFNFAIFKSDDELNAEKESVLKKLKPYFSINHDIQKQKREELQNNFESQWKTKYGNGKDKKYKNYINTCLALFDSVYSKGIIKMPDDLDKADKNVLINLLKGNVAEERKLSSFFTIKTANEFFKESIKKKKISEQDFLLYFLENSINHNIIYNEDVCKRMQLSVLNNISLTRGMVQVGENVISKGEVITNEKYQILESLKKEYETHLSDTTKYYSILLGQMILVFVLITALALFLFSFRKDIFADNKKILFILFLIFMMVFITRQTIIFKVSYLYILPICIVPIIIRAFYDTRMALFVHIVTIIIIGFLAPNSFEFVFIELVAGIISIISIVNLRKRSQLFFTSFLIFITYLLIYIGMTLMQEGKIYDENFISIKLFAGSALLTLLSYPLIFVFEKLFGFYTDVSLMELSDSNTQLLRQLAQKAPGTFQHSMQVANLAEEATNQIGGNSLLVRAGAMYHDIGKIDNSLYFSENQSTGVNPHNELPYDESAKILISHVIKGIEKAKKYNIPDQVIDFIRTHHGTKKTMYFYSLFCEHNKNNAIDEKKFTYHGPVPFSKETAVVMMADAVEASSRSLKQPNEETIDKLVDTVIAKQINMEQFINANITFKDITIIKKIFKKKLMNIYHVRIEYID